MKWLWSAETQWNVLDYIYYFVYFNRTIHINTLTAGIINYQNNLVSTHINSINNQKVYFLFRQNLMIWSIVKVKNFSLC